MIIQEDEVMVSFDVVSFFTKIPVELALEVAQCRLMDWTEFENHTNWSIEDVGQGGKICLESTFLHVRGKNYKQVFGMAMGSPVSAVVANIIMEDIESRAERNCPENNKLPFLSLIRMGLEPSCKSVLYS